MTRIACSSGAECAVAGHGVLAPAGLAAEILHDHLVQVTLITLIVIVPVFVALPILLWRYRLSRNDGRYAPEWRFAWLPEFVIWGVPLIIVGVLGFPLWNTLHRIDPYRPLDAGREPPLRVQVIGLDWKFLFIYPDEDIASVNRLVVPAGREIAFDITADGPMMSFMVPRLGGQIYAMAGMRTKLHLIADAPGSYRGLNTQYNGSNFVYQKFDLQAVSQDEYRQWVRQSKARPPLDQQHYRRLSRPSVVEQPIGFGRVEDDLFAAVIAAYHDGQRPPGEALAIAGTAGR